MAVDSIVALRHVVALATKKWIHQGDGKTHVESYGFGKTFKAEVVELGGLEDLYGLLERLAPDPRTFLIRGEPIPGRDLEAITRTKNAKGEPPSFREIPRHWLMLDVDGGGLSGIDWSTPRGCEDVANRVLGLMPLELRRAGYVWQASAGAGMKAGARMHLWFWLDRPMGEHELTLWGDFTNENSGKKLLDVAVFRTVQPHYIATPIFDGLLDPVARRLGYVPGAPASLPRMSAKGESWRRKLEPLYFENNDKIHDHVRDACAAFFCANGVEAPDDLLVKSIRAAVARAEEIQGRQGEYNEDKIAGEIQSGRDFAGSRVSSGENLLRDAQGNPKSTIGNVISVMRAHDDWQKMLAWDMRSHRIHIMRETPWKSQPGEWVDSRDSVRAAEWFVQQPRMACDDGTILRAATTLAREWEFDPVADWLSDLEWDVCGRLDNWLTGWCGAAPSAYVRRVGRMMLIGAVARAFIPGCKLDTVTVLQGETGAHKSTLVEILGGEWFASVDEEKDILQKIHGPWFCELPELGPFRSLNYNRIKSFTSTRSDRFRAPYMRLPEDRPRTNVLVATVNPEGIGWQEDATSARRFWPVDVGEIDTDSIAAARDQLFAEAVVAFRAGEQWWVDSPRDPDFVPAQEAIYAHDTWQDVIERILITGATNFASGRQVVIDKNAETVRMSDLLFVCFGDQEQPKRAQHRAARALMRLGWAADTHGIWKKGLRDGPIADRVTG